MTASFARSLGFFAALFVPQVALAEGEDLPFLLSDPPAADSEWFSAYDGTWDPDWDRLWSRSTAPFQLNVVAGLAQDEANSSSTSMSSGRDYYAMATLQIPLETSVTRVGSAPPAEPVETRPDFDNEERNGSTRVEPEATEEKPLEGDPQSADRRGIVRDVTRLTKAILQRIEDEPTRKASLRDLASLHRRSRLSGLVPELRLRGVYGFDETVSQQDSGGLYPGDSTTRGGRDSLVEARLTFRLDRLIYGDRESSLYQKRRDVLSQSRKDQKDAIDALVAWMTAKREASDPSLLPDELFQALGREEQALLTLYHLTGGWFRGEVTIEELDLEKLMLDLGGTSDGAEAQEREELGGSSRRTGDLAVATTHPTEDPDEAGPR